MSEIEKLRGLLREIRRHNSSGLTRDMQARIDAALSQQAEQQPKHTHANKHKPHCLLLDPEEAQCHCTCGLEPAQTAPRGETK